MNARPNPLIDPPPAEIPLKHAPLVRVIVQIRFPEMLSISDRGFVAPFQEAIRDRYPVLRQEQIAAFRFGSAGLEQAKPSVAWRFSDVEGEWRASLTPTFLALETTKYVSRADLLAKVRFLAAALEKHVAPRVVDRIGVRYIDRIVGADVGKIEAFVRAEVRGIAGSAVAASAVHSVVETLFEAPDECKVLTKWGFLPKNFTADPDALEPVDQVSWILDLDMFRTQVRAFDVSQALGDIESFAERIYAVFRWAVTPEFLRRFGGES